MRFALFFYLNKEMSYYRSEIDFFLIKNCLCQ